MQGDAIHVEHLYWEFSLSKTKAFKNNLPFPKVKLQWAQQKEESPAFGPNSHNTLPKNGFFKSDIN